MPKVSEPGSVLRCPIKPLEEFLMLISVGMTTYEFLKPKVNIPSPTSSSRSRKSVPDISCMEDDESVVNGEPSGSISISRELNRENSVETVAGSDTLWNTMTEIDLHNANNDASVVVTLPKNQNQGLNGQWGTTKSGGVTGAATGNTTQSWNFRKLLFWKRVNRVNTTQA
jgi:hypothetical protein